MCYFTLSSSLEWSRYQNYLESFYKVGNPTKESNIYPCPTLTHTREVSIPTFKNHCHNKRYYQGEDVVFLTNMDQKKKTKNLITTDVKYKGVLRYW